jgi:hypothetical protein
VDALLTPVNEGALRPLWGGSQKEVEDLIVAAFPIVDLVSQGSWFGAFAAAVQTCDHDGSRQQGGITTPDMPSHRTTRGSTATSAYGPRRDFVGRIIRVHTDLFNAGRRSGLQP